MMICKNIYNSASLHREEKYNRSNVLTEKTQKKIKLSLQKWKHKTMKLEKEILCYEQNNKDRDTNLNNLWNHDSIQHRILERALRW